MKKEAGSTVTEDRIYYTWVEVIPCDDDWPGYEKMVGEFLKNWYEPPRREFVLIEMQRGWDGMFFPWPVGSVCNGSNFNGKAGKKEIG